MAAYECRGSGLQHPGDFCGGRDAFDRLQDGQHVHHVAHGAHHHDENVVEWNGPRAPYGFASLASPRGNLDAALAETAHPEQVVRRNAELLARLPLVQ